MGKRKAFSAKDIARKDIASFMAKLKEVALGKPSIAQMQALKELLTISEYQTMGMKDEDMQIKWTDIEVNQDNKVAPVPAPAPPASEPIPAVPTEGK